MLEELYEAFSVENVTTGESCAGVGAELGGVAYSAKIIYINTFKVSSVFAASALLWFIMARVVAIESLIGNFIFLLKFIDVII